MRGSVCRDFPGIGWIGLADMNEEVGLKLKADLGADFFTTDVFELIARPEVDAVIIAKRRKRHVAESDDEVPLPQCLVTLQVMMFNDRLIGSTAASKSPSIMCALPRLPRLHQLSGSRKTTC